MNKTLFAIVTTVLLFLTSARYVAPSDGRVGYQAPSMELSNAFTTVNLQDLRGQYVVVTFWSSALPASRMANKELSAAAETTKDVVYLAVNMDRSNGLFEQLVAADHLNVAEQFHIAFEDQDKVMEQWRQESDRFTSFVIGPEGKIVKINPSAGDIAKL